MNKKLFLITASLATGLVGSLIIKKRKQPNLSPNDVFVGEWYYSKKNQTKVTLTITPNFELLIPGKKQPVAALTILPHRIVFLDQLGYEIVFEQKDQQFSYFDETEDAVYEIFKHI